MIARILILTRLNRLITRFAPLRGDQSGLALVEFAMSMPILIVLMTSGIEMANYVVVTKQIGEVSVMIADNASRMGAQNAINNKPISEAEINDVFIGADLQGTGLNLATNSRIVLSSLQQNGDGGQTIKWQRCFGAQTDAPAYGVQGDGATGTSFPGMGPSTNRITAAPGTAVMVVEIYYHYPRIMPLLNLPLKTVREVSAYNVRDSRDLTQVYNTENVPVSSCA